MSTWSESVTAQVGTNLARLRRPRTAQALSDRTAELGHRVGRVTIAEYEAGRRKTVPVTDLLVLAAALEVPPVELLWPGLPDDEVETLPEVRTTAAEALLWTTGEDALPGLAFATDTELLRTFRQWHSRRVDAETIRNHAALLAIGSGSSPLSAEELAAQLDRADADIVRLRSDLDRLAGRA